MFAPTVLYWNLFCLLHLEWGHKSDCFVSNWVKGLKHLRLDYLTFDLEVQATSLKVKCPWSTQGFTIQLSEAPDQLIKWIRSGVLQARSPFWTVTEDQKSRLQHQHMDITEMFLRHWGQGQCRPCWFLTVSCFWHRWKNKYMYVCFQQNKT